MRVIPGHRRTQVPLRTSDRIGNLYSPQSAVLYLDAKSNSLAWLSDLPLSYVTNRTAAAGEAGSARVASGDTRPLPRSEWRLTSAHWAAQAAEVSADVTLSSWSDSADPSVSKRVRSAGQRSPRPEASPRPDTATLLSSAITQMSLLTDSADTQASLLLPPPRYGQRSTPRAAPTDTSAASLSQSRYWTYIVSGVDMFDSSTVPPHGSEAVPESAAPPHEAVCAAMPSQWMERVSKRLPPAPATVDAITRANTILDAEMQLVSG